MYQEILEGLSPNELGEFNKEFHKEATGKDLNKSTKTV